MTSGGGRGEVRPMTSGGGRGEVRPMTSGGGRGEVRPMTSGGGRGEVRPMTSGGGRDEVRPMTSGGGVRPTTGERDTAHETPGSPHAAELTGEEIVVRNEGSGGRREGGGGWNDGGTRGEVDGHGEHGGDATKAKETCPVIRLLVLGGHGVGKSDIIYRQSLQVDGMKVDLEIIDISSRPGDNTLPTLEICQCDCYLVVYSVAERHTFLTANQLLHAIFKLRPHLPRPPITLLGNKQDLEHSRQVTPEEGQTTSSVFGCAFAEVSVAETSEDIVPIFSSLIRRARTTSCLCPRFPSLLLEPAVCSSSCQHTFFVGSYSCRRCGCPGSPHSKSASKGRNMSPPSRSVSEGNGKILHQSVSGETSVVKRQDSERTNKRVSRGNIKKLAVRSNSSPLHGSQNISKVKDKPQRQSSTPSASRTVADNTGQHSPRQVKQETEKETILKSSESAAPVHAPLSRSLSSPEAWSESRSCDEDSPPKPKTDPVKESKREKFFASLKGQESSLSLLSRGRSFILDSKRSETNPECSCRTRTRSFKSSGKVEIVNIKKPETKLCSKDEHHKPEAGVGASLQQDKWSSKFSGARLSKKDFNNTQPSILEENQTQSSSLSLSGAWRTPRSPKRFPLDPLEAGTVDDDCPSPTSGRQRKFSVFGVGRALGNFLSKGSLPDLPRATANICDKFGSLKRTIKKRSV
ncbi:uncharacterized protein LOC121861397 isoform X2 [Homarus americanus]|uniref:uncharacterized protein LOC121861397 isoform X2 n=1 Tax=Homarus americanus TaxID=6706 RepID=UPI001C48A722|nr:uncharacterized protein LOC121861397 isoform X2 [Homarus americanus]